MKQQDLLDDLADRMRLAPPDRFGQVLHDVVFKHTGVDVDLYLVDYAQTVLHPLLRPGVPSTSQLTQPLADGRSRRRRRSPLSEVTATRPPRMAAGAERR